MPALIPPPLPPATVEPLPAVLITELCDLLFYPFIKCAVDGDYSGLVKSGKPSEEELRSAWMHILGKYYELSGSREIQSHVKTVGKIEALNTKILQTEEIVDLLKTIKGTPQAEILYQTLKIWGYADPRNLERVMRELANDRLKLAVLKKKYDDEQQKKSGKGEPATRQMYIRALHTIEQHKKLVFDRQTLNMEDFALYVRELDEHNRSVTSK